MNANNKKQDRQCSRVLERVFSCHSYHDNGHFSKWDFLAMGSFLFFVLTLCAFVMFENLRNLWSK